METAGALADGGARVSVWHPPRPSARWLVDGVCGRADGAVEVRPLPVPAGRSLWARGWGLGRVWRYSHRALGTRRPDVVVGFGGWVSVPVLLAARQHRIPCVIHEQNVRLGRANRWLAPRVDRVAVSFAATQQALGAAGAVFTGLPVREGIGRVQRHQAAARFALDPARRTVFVLGGSQGSTRLNTLWTQAVSRLTAEERRGWQALHLTGSADEARVRAIYAEHGLRAWVAASCADMAQAYALADVAVTRAGASTLAELVRCAVPAVLIPYPFAQGHQRANADVLAAAGGAVVMEEREADAAQVLGAVRWVLTDEGQRARMGAGLRGLDVPDATQRLTEVIRDVAAVGAC
jgi:UDP-N-acetylglucosamine--N-acetylmuramyl-(pentapeptide) pyrophosphoryl-undecaprenol N-acetylglucosamine transferase